MSTYPDPRRVVLTLADLRRLTILERARACAVAGVGADEIAVLLRGLADGAGASPDALERGALLMYALAYQLERRLDPALTWEAMQACDLALDLDAFDPIAEAEAVASVEAAIATGLPPDVAGELTLAQVEAYANAREPAGSR